MSVEIPACGHNRSPLASFAVPRCFRPKDVIERRFQNMTGSVSRLAATRLGATALAGFSALLGVVMVASINAPAVAQLMGHFGMSWQDGAAVVTMVLAGSWALFFLFPYLAPWIGTVRLLLFYFGSGALIGW
jgi:hypothetical protein